MSFSLLIDPGHGGTNLGCSGNGASEKEVNLAISVALCKAAKALGIDVLMTRTRDEYVTLEDRGRNPPTDLVLVLHCDSAAHPMAGQLTTYRRPKPVDLIGVAEKIAKDAPEVVQPALPNPPRAFITSPTDWTYRADNCLKHHTSPALLIEMGFLTNPKQAAYLTSPAGVAGMVACLLGGVALAWHDKLNPPTLA